MLDDLDAIDWSRLTHAYGPATNVPDMLRALASADRDTRENAFDGQFWTIHHQGTIYDSTAPAVPFLLELVERPDVRARHLILDLLEAIAGGYGYVQVHGRYDSAAVQASAEFRQTLDEERSCQEAVREAVGRGRDLFLALLRDPDRKIRPGALKVLARLLTHPRPALPAVVDSLVGLLRDETFAGRAGVLCILADAVRVHADPETARAAATDHQAHDVNLFNGTDEEREPPEWLRPTAEDRSWGREAVAAVWRGWPVYDALSGSASAAVREAAVFTQALLLQHAGPAMPPEIARERPRERLVARWAAQLSGTVSKRLQADLTFALAAVAPENPRVRTALRELLRTTRSRVVGYVAALKLVDLEGAVPERGLRVLTAAHFAGRKVYEQLRRLPRWDNYLALPRLRRLGPAVVEQRLEKMVEVVRRAGDAGGFGAGRAKDVFRLAFAGARLPAGATAADLTEAQRRLLRAAVDNGFFWARLMNNRLGLERFGLPEERRDLRRFLAGPGERVSPPAGDPEDALVVFEELVRRTLPFQAGFNPYHREEGDTRAPFRMIQEGVEELRRRQESYRPGDRPQVERLEVYGHACDALLALVHLCPNLRELDLAWGEATDEGLAHLARLTGLEKLDLYGNWVTDAGVARLAGLTNLRELSLGGTDITDEGLKSLAGMTELRSLHLGATRIRGPGLAHLARLRRLDRLWFCSDSLTDEATPLLGQFRALKNLTYGGKDVSDRGLDAWAGLADLESLTLRLGRFSEEGMRRFPVLPALTSLDFFWCRSLTDECVRLLPGLPALSSLSLFRTPVTDAALEGIARFPALRRLNLAGTGVTDAVVPYLLRLGGLDWVGLQDTRVSAAAVGELKRAFPEAGVGT
jgi:hypothetical protein